jgi:hypothetical protein
MFRRDVIPLTKQGQYRLLKATIEGLRCHAPAAYPVIVRSSPNMPVDADAYCSRRNSRFVIMLGQHLSASRAPEIIVHEWAHARAWHHRHDEAIATAASGGMSDEEFEAACHDAAWGVEYANCWRVFTGVVLPEFEGGGRNSWSWV